MALQRDNRVELAWTERAGALSQALKDKGLTRREVARRLGVSASYVSRWLNGTRVPDVEQFEALIRLADVSADELLGLESSVLRQRVEAARQAREALDRALEKAERRPP